MDKKFRLLSAEIVMCSKLPASVKKQFISFIKEAPTDAHVKALLMDGEIVKLDKEAEKLVEQRWELSEAGGRVAKIRKTYSSMAGSSGGVNPIWLIYRKVRSLYDQCTRRCGKYEVNTTRRQHCMIKCKVAKYKAQLAAAKKANNQGEIQKSEASLAKAEAELKKSIASFKSRGAETD